MRPSSPTLLAGLLIVASAGCETRESVATELYIAELEQQVVELETQLNTAWEEVSRLSGMLSTQVGDLESAVDDLNRRVLDLPAGEPQFTIPEVEAAVAVTQQRLTAVRAVTNDLARYVE